METRINLDTRILKAETYVDTDLGLQAIANTNVINLRNKFPFLRRIKELVKIAIVQCTQLKRIALTNIG